MGEDALACERRAALSGGRNVGRDAALDGIAAPRPVRREQRILRSSTSFVQTDGEGGLGLVGERDGVLLASLAFD